MGNKLLITLIVIAKLYISYLLINERLGFVWYQFAICPFITIGLFYTLKKIIQTEKWLYFTLLLDFFLPIYGILSIVLTLIILPFFSDPEGDENDQHDSFYMQDFEQNLAFKQAKLEFNEFLDKDKSYRDSFIQPYLDIFSGDDSELKIDACIKLSNFDDYPAIKLLKIALQDSEYDVRYMANNALNKIENKFMSEVEQLTHLIEKYPAEKTNFRIRGNAYVKIYSSKILDETLSNYFLEKAIADFQEVVLSNPTDFNSFSRIAYIYARLKKFNELQTLCTKALALNPPEREKAKLEFYLAESYFFEKDYKNLIKTASTINTKALEYEKINIPTKYWAGGLDG